VYLPKSVVKISVLDERDDVLGCHKMKVEFKAGEQSPLLEGGGETTHICFYPLDQSLQEQSRVFHGSERTKASERGRGRGGRGGRGRGRGQH
jgi:DNA topoisomerase-3